MKNKFNSVCQWKEITTGHSLSRHTQVHAQSDGWWGQREIELYCEGSVLGLECAGCGVHSGPLVFSFVFCFCSFLLFFLLLPLIWPANFILLRLAQMVERETVAENEKYYFKVISRSLVQFR